jgi:NAD(P)H-quinone oxidoreductase subunit 5
MASHQIIIVLGAATCLIPLALLICLGVASLLSRPLPEVWTSRLIQFATVLGLCAAASLLLYMLATGERYVPVELGNWASIPEFRFSIKLLFDRLSVPLVLLTFLLCGTIGAFSTRYLHREPGYNRFFVLFALFLLGMILTSLAGTIETLFTGWELVGISSALLVAFFQERSAPVRNGLRVWSVYRISDAALLIAAVLLHHLKSQGDFHALLGSAPWPYGHSERTISSTTALVVGTLLLIAAAGKSALIPFSGWLPRAMEGPTPSSAIYYGSLSVHLGAYLLLRMGPVLELSLVLCLMTSSLGLATALLAVAAGRVQSDIKSALAFASLSQVGLIVTEIGIAGALAFGAANVSGSTSSALLIAATGLRYIALVHLIGHACLRTLQFLRASSVLQDYRMLENAIGQRLAALRSPTPRHPWWYRFALERGYLDAILVDYIARPVLSVFKACDRLERAWTNFLCGGAAHEPEETGPMTRSLEDLT